MHGFTLEVHGLLARLLDLLDRLGVELSWRTKATGINWSSSSVSGIALEDGSVLEARHYVISPGAYGESILRGTSAAGVITGVLGVWLRLPNLEPALDVSLKIARRGQLAQDANITVVRASDDKTCLLVGAGYGWTGFVRGAVDQRQLDSLYSAAEDTARRFFPEACELALSTDRQYCIRPWTPSGLGVFATHPAVNGGKLVIAGGHNTGGFAQAPAVADAVLAWLRGEHHPMHELYRPSRDGHRATTSAVQP